MIKILKTSAQWVGFFLLLLLINAVYAQAADNTKIVNTAPLNAEVNNTKTQNAENTADQAQNWDLTLEEWQHYLKLMQGKNGHWYPQLTPPQILGLNADNQEDQKHFAEIVAKQEHDKLARELAFNNAVYQAMQKLYVHEPMVKPFDLSSYNPINTGKNKIEKHGF